MLAIYSWRDCGNLIDELTTVRGVTHTFWKDNVKIILAPMKESGEPKPNLREGVSLLFIFDVLKEAQETKEIDTLVSTMDI